MLLAPTTPWPAPAIGAPWTTRIGGTEVVTRSHLGIYTQPLSFIGLPVISVPIVAAGALPLGVQLVAAPSTRPCSSGSPPGSRRWGWWGPRLTLPETWLPPGVQFLAADAAAASPSPTDLPVFTPGFTA